MLLASNTKELLPPATLKGLWKGRVHQMLESYRHIRELWTELRLQVKGYNTSQPVLARVSPGNKYPSVTLLPSSDHLLVPSLG